MHDPWPGHILGSWVQKVPLRSHCITVLFIICIVVRINKYIHYFNNTKFMMFGTHNLHLHKTPLVLNGVELEQCTSINTWHCFLILLQRCIIHWYCLSLKQGNTNILSTLQRLQNRSGRVLLQWRRCTHSNDILSVILSVCNQRSFSYQVPKLMLEVNIYVSSCHTINTFNSRMIQFRLNARVSIQKF